MTPPLVLSLGELLVEIMRTRTGEPLSQPGTFAGPFPSGAPAIFIDAIARLGGNAGFVGVCGDDPFGECVLCRLQQDGVQTQYIRRIRERITGIAFVSYRSNGGRDFLFHLAQSAAAQLHAGDINAAYFRTARWLHITGSALSFSEGSRKACLKALQLVKDSGGSVSFDPNLRPELMPPDELRGFVAPVLQAADLILPSGAEASLLTGIPDPISACHALIQNGIPLVALKQGAAGSTLFSSSAELHIPSIPVTEVDPTGAGDCYDAALVLAILGGFDLPTAARFANVAGALSVQKLGPMEGIPTRDEVLDRM